MSVDSDLLNQFKLSIGDFNGSDLDNYYINQLSMAQSDLVSDDISEAQLNGELGRALTILYAESLMNKTDIATNPTISLLRNKLSLMTKGEKVDANK